MTAKAVRISPQETKQLIDDLGGAKAVAMILNIHPRTVHGWVEKGLAVGKASELRLMAERKGTPRPLQFNRKDSPGGDHRSKGVLHGT